MPDLPEIYNDAITYLKRSDPILGQLIAQIGPCHLGDRQQTGNLLTCLTRTIIHQQLSIKSAASIHRRFLAIFGEHPPTAAQLLTVTDEQLRGAGLSRPKIRYVRDLAHKMPDLLAIEDLGRLTNDEIVTHLTQVQGIGRWSVQMLLIFRLHRWDVWPHEDLGIQNALQRLYQMDQRPDKKHTDTLGQPWKPYRSIAAWYLWRSLEMDQWG